ESPADVRLIALAEVRDLTPLRDASGRVAALPELEHVLATCLDGIVDAQDALPADRRPQWNRVLLYAWPTIDISLDDLLGVVRKLAPLTTGLGLEQVILQGRLGEEAEGGPREVVVRVARPPGMGLTVTVTPPPTEPLQPMDAYTQKVLQARRRGAVYPYELVPLLVRPRTDNPD